MKSYKSFLFSATLLLIACFFASCEKAEVAPNLPNQIKLTIEGMFDTYEFTSTEDYSNTVLRLPKGGEYEMYVEVSSSPGVQSMSWDTPRYFFDHDDFISTHEFWGINGPSIWRWAYSYDDFYLASNEINASWEMETWGPNKDLGSWIPKPIHLKLVDRNGNELIMDINIEYSNGEEGLF